MRCPACATLTCHHVQCEARSGYSNMGTHMDERLLREEPRPETLRSLRERLLRRCAELASGRSRCILKWPQLDSPRKPERDSSRAAAAVCARLAASGGESRDSLRAAKVTEGTLTVSPSALRLASQFSHEHLKLRSRVQNLNRDLI